MENIKKKDKKEEYLISDDSVKKSFVISPLILFGSSFITLIESLKNDSVRARHILNLETVVSIIAGYVYLHP